MALIEANVRDRINKTRTMSESLPTLVSRRIVIDVVSDVAVPSWR